MWPAYPSSHDLTGSITLTSSCSSHMSCLSNWHTSINRSITLSPPSLSLTLKILLASRSPIKGTVSSNLIYYSLSLMPPSLTSVYYAALVAFILSVSEVMPSCSYYIKKGLVYIIIISLFGCQPLSCTKYIKVNICLSYNIYSISATKYIYYLTLLNCLVPYLSYYRVLDLIRCWET